MLIAPERENPIMKNRSFKSIALGERGGASVEYLAGVLAVVFAAWVAMQAFAPAATKGIKSAGADLLGVK